MAEDVKIEIPAKFKDIVEAVEKLPIIELNELVKLLEEKWGVSATAAPTAPVAGVAGAVVEEKSTVTVHLKESGATKIAVIKVVKEVFGLGLKEAKDLVDAAPSVLKEGMKKTDADEVKKKLEAAGAKIELK